MSIGSIKKALADGGKGSFLQGGALRRFWVDNPEQAPEGDRFICVVDSVKRAPEGIKNAAFVVRFDETPIADIYEWPVNVTNANRVARFLESVYGSDDTSNLVLCPMVLRLKQFPQYVNEDGSPTWGIEIVEIHPSNADDGFPMVFCTDEEAAPVVPAEKGPTPAQQKRAEFLQRMKNNKPEKKSADNKKRK